MSLVYKVVEDLVDDLLDQVKGAIDEYATSLKHDLEAFLDKMMRRAVKTMAIGLLGAVLVSAGFVFSLIGLVTYLSPIISPALAWGSVGIVMLGIGAASLLIPLRRRSRSPKMRHISRLEDGD
jgi:Putative Actinobacterial Holin-X, holin superfamily III